MGGVGSPQDFSISTSPLGLDLGIKGLGPGLDKNTILYNYLFITSERSQLEKNTQTIVAGCSRTYSFYSFFIWK